MKAMILAAGRGERLRPLTDKTPKPLLKVAGLSLIEYHLNNLQQAGVNEIIINTAWLAEKIHQQLGDGAKYGVSIRYSDEGEALETAGGIIKALPLLGDEPFLVINGDIYCDMDLAELTDRQPILNHSVQAHLVLVDNPAHHAEGDFALQRGLIKNTGAPRYTFSGIGLYSAAFFAEQTVDVLRLAPIIRNKCQSGLVSGQYYNGQWTDVGSIDRLQQLESQLSKKQ